MLSADQPWAIRRAAVASSRVDLGSEGDLMWPRTDFLESLGIIHPIVQAPMSGFTPPALVTAVCNAGGLGSIGCVGQPPDVVREQVAAVRQATNRPFNLNFFVHRSPQTSPEATARMRARLAPYFNEYGLGPVPEPTEPLSTFNAEQLDLVLELRPRVVSFHFGLP
ncbi:MAG TPA: nitronate monooxygenase, partial [Stellaceae bacterium]|nr:nitronate monooxygenase [Stellaceae bacterium]